MSMKAINWASDQICGSPSAKVTLWSIAWYAGPETWLTWTSQTKFAEQTEQSPDSVQRRIPDLVARGLLKRMPLRYEGRRSTDLHILRPSKYWHASIEEIEKLLPRGFSVDPKFAASYVPADCGSSSATDGETSAAADCGDTQPQTLPQSAENVTALVRQHEPRTLPGEPERDARARDGQEDDPDADWFAFKAVWPDIALEAHGLAREQLNALTPSRRKKAIAAVPAFIAFHRERRGKKPLPYAHIYLSEKRWEDLPEPGRKAPDAPFQAEAFSKDWWIIWHKRIAAGLGVSLMVSFASAGKPWSLDPEPTHAEREAFAQVGVDFPEWLAWEELYRLKGIKLPRPDQAEFAWMPSLWPPGHENSEIEKEREGA